MITPLLLHKERLVRITEYLSAGFSRREIAQEIFDAIREVDRLVESQVELDRAHRDEVAALMGRV